MQWCIREVGAQRIVQFVEFVAFSIPSGLDTQGAASKGQAKAATVRIAGE